MFSALAATPTATATASERSGSLRRTLRAILSTTLSKIGSGRTRDAIRAECMALYHADETKLKEMGLTRMDVIRLLETKGHALDQKMRRSANLPSRPMTTPRDPLRHQFPMAILVLGLMRS